MEFLGIGPLELAFILIIALIILGPNDMVKAGKAIGRTLRSIVTSPNWRAIQQTSREIRSLPNKLMREAGLDELQKNLPQADTIRRELGVDEMGKEIQDLNKQLSDWTTPPTIGTPPQSPDNPSDSPSPSESSDKTHQD
jgi:Sec-independent protein translocase protein TatA